MLETNIDASFLKELHKHGACHIGENDEFHWGWPQKCEKCCFANVLQTLRRRVPQPRGVKYMGLDVGLMDKMDVLRVLEIAMDRWLASGSLGDEGVGDFQ